MLRIYVKNPAVPTTAPDTVKYGLLYNWYAATDARLIAASGWEVPEEPNIVTLAEFLGGAWNAGALNYGAVGGKLRETGETYWTDETNATNETEFNARGNGDRNQLTGIFENLRAYSFAWTRTQSSSTAAYGFHCSDGGDLLQMDNQLKKKGYAVRLLKTTTTLSDGQTGSYTGNDGKVYRTICIGTQEWMADNLAETKFQNGDYIHGYELGVYTPIEDGDWAALTTDGVCVYNDDTDNI